MAGSAPIRREREPGAIFWGEGDGIVKWVNGDITQTTTDGTSPYPNSRGDVAFLRWNDSTQRWDTWLYIGGDDLKRK